MDKPPDFDLLARKILDSLNSKYFIWEDKERGKAMKKTPILTAANDGLLLPERSMGR